MPAPSAYHSAVLAGDTSVYVHVPFCARRCPYCDFATDAIAPSDVPSADYVDGVLRELEARSHLLAERKLFSIFLGGGTPSLLAPRDVARLLAGILSAFDRRVDDVEVTAECNPSSFDDAKAAGFAEAGVNRVSLGVQSLDDASLRFLGRLHDRDGALAALSRATRHVPRVSGDLMFGMPGQSAERLADEIRQLVDVGVEHVSAYSLTIEQGTPFHELARKGRLPLASEDECARMFVSAEPVFAALGFARYEVSNYARPGAEARHNQHYWRSGNYLGLGAAAVGCLDQGAGRARRYRNLPGSPRYLGAPADACEEWSEDLDGPTLVREALMLALRTDEGLDRAYVEARAGQPLERGREAALARALAQGALVEERGFLRVPRAGWLHLDALLRDLF